MNAFSLVPIPSYTCHSATGSIIPRSRKGSCVLVSISSPFVGVLCSYIDIICITVPFWKLAGSLEELSVSGIACGPNRDSSVVREASVEDLTSFELPELLPSADVDARLELQLSIIHRTIVTAAQRGQLKRLDLGGGWLHRDAPFAIRELIPFWVAVESWYFPVYLDCGPWLDAASQFRSALAHASLWLHESVAGAAHSRLLTREDVQALYSRFTQSGFKFRSAHQNNRLKHGEITDHAIKRYFSWLKEDDGLSQRVADAWAAVVLRGDADAVKCHCAKCPGL